MIDEANLRFYRSVDDGLGGAPSTVPVTDGVFDDVRAIDAENGQIDYRCVYFMNTDPDQRGLLEPSIWIDRASDYGQLSFGLDPGGKNSVAKTLPDQRTAPEGVKFRAPNNFVTSLDLPDGPYLEGEFVAIWVRRAVPKGATEGQNFVLKVRGESYR